MKIVHDLAMAIRQLRVRRDSVDDLDFEAVLESLHANDDEQVRISDHEKGGAILNILAERLVNLSGYILQKTGKEKEKES